MQISGTFQVDVSPLKPYIEDEHSMAFSRLGIEKIYLGDLSAKAYCEFLYVRTATEGSAGYVALEQITGSLCGKHGSFVIQEYATMNQGQESSIREVVPDSGTEELSGLSGIMKTMRIEGEYVYEFEFNLPEQKPPQEKEQNTIDDEEKNRLMEDILGKENATSWFSLIPYEISGSLHQYYYPYGIKGTGIATKQLTHNTKRVPMNDAFTLYELVMFTQAAISPGLRGINDFLRCEEDMTPEPEGDSSLDFEKARGDIAEILNAYAPYCTHHKVNPNDTAEMPADRPHIGGKCFVFLDYKPIREHHKQHFGMMLIMEIFRSEMIYAQQHGSHKLVDLLKQHNYYPYSDMNRTPVV